MSVYIKQLSPTYNIQKISKSQLHKEEEENLMQKFTIDYISCYIRINKPLNKHINLAYWEEQRLKHITDKYKAKITIYRDKLNMSFCPSKFLYDTEDNTKGVTKQELISCLEKLHSIIEEIESVLGFKAESTIYNANLLRIDLTKNIYTDHLFHSYISVFESLRPKQNLCFKKTRDIMETTYSTVYFKSRERTRGNNSLIIRIYDKKQELQSKKIFIPMTLSNKNIMRFEVSLNNSKIIQSKLNINSINELLNVGFDYLDNKREEILHEYLFYEHIKENTKCLNSLDDLALAKQIHKNNNRNTIYKYFITNCTNNIDYKYHKEILIKAGLKESNIESQFKDIKGYRRQYRSNMAYSVTLSSLYKEIYDKLFPVKAETKGFDENTA